MQQEQGPKLADKGWERVQKKTFTGWVNYHLKKRELSVEDIEKDFSDGTKLSQLLEIISEQKIGCPHKAPKSRPQMLDNLTKSVAFINAFAKEVGIKTTFGSEQICDGGSMMLGLIWIFILRYSVGDISEEDKSAKEGLLLWVRKVLKPYDIPMNNFTRDWQDGKAFTGLIHRFHPDWIENPGTLEKANSVANCSKAFNLAEDKLAIPQLLDAQDLQDFPDEKSVITYVAFFWKAFAADNATLKAGANIGKFFGRIKAQKAMQDDYEKRARELAAWMDGKTTFFDAKDVGTSYEDALEKMKNFQDVYKVSEKPPKSGDRVRLEVALANIHARIAKEGGPAYNVPQGLSTEDLSLRWKRMQEAEEEYERALREALIRKKKIQAFLGKFDQKCKLLNGWVDDKQVYLNDGVVGDSLYETEGLLKKLDAYDEEFNAYAPRYDSVKTLGEQIKAEDASTSGYVDGKLATVNSNRDSLPALASAKREALKNRIQELNDNENRKVQFAKDTAVFNLWIEDVTEVITDPIKCDHVEEVAALQGGMPELEAQVAGKAADLSKIEADETKLIGANPYTRFSAADCRAKYTGVQDQLAQRKAGLDAEMATQNSREELRKKFGANIATVAAFLADITHKLAQIGGALPEQREKVTQLQQEKKGATPLLEAASAANDACLAADISDNPHAKQTYTEVNVQSMNLDDALRDKLSEIERDIIKGDMPAISAEQLEEYREVFTHFDKDKSNSLEVHEFKACLSSLGVNFNDAEIAETIANMNLATPNKINFSEFTTYMAAQNKEAASKDDIVASFKAFAPGTGVTEEQLAGVLDADSLAYALSIMPKNPDGTYNYTEFCDQAFKK